MPWRTCWWTWCVRFARALLARSTRRLGPGRWRCAARDLARAVPRVPAAQVQHGAQARGGCEPGFLCAFSRHPRVPQVHKLDNLMIVFKFLEAANVKYALPPALLRVDECARLESVKPRSILEGNEQAIMGLIWTLIKAGGLPCVPCPCIVLTPHRSLSSRR